MGSGKWELGTWPFRFRRKGGIMWFLLSANVDLVLLAGATFLRVDRGAAIPEDKLNRRGINMLRRLLANPMIEAVAVCERRHFCSPINWCVVGIRLVDENSIQPNVRLEQDFAWATASLISRSVYGNDRIRFVASYPIIDCPTCNLCWSQTP